MSERTTRSGEDFDYGLAPGESFEPDELADIDAGQPHIMTALGPIWPGALDVTNAAANFGRLAIAADSSGGQSSLLGELDEAVFAGISAMILNRPVQDRTEAEQILWYAQRSNLHFLVGTPVGIPSLDGLFGTGLRPGFLFWVDGASAADVAPGYPILKLDAGSSDDVEALLSQTGIQPASIILRAENERSANK